METENKLILSTCKELNLSPALFMSGLRKRPYTDARRICVGLMLEEGKISLQDIATIVGFKNHTSVIHLRESYTDLMKVDKIFREKRDRVKGSLIDAGV